MKIIDESPPLVTTDIVVNNNPSIILYISIINGAIEALKIIMGWHALATGLYKYIVHLFLTILTI